MTVKAILLLVVIAAFGALSAVALADHGYFGLFLYQFQTTAGWQVLADLVVASTLIMAWMIGDARRSGRNVWPWLLMTLALGSFGPLAYLLVGELQRRDARHALA